MNYLDKVLAQLGDNITELFMEMRDGDVAYVITSETRENLPDWAIEEKFEFSQKVTILNDLETIKNVLGSNSSESGYAILEKGSTNSVYKLVKEEELPKTYFDDYQYQGEEWFYMTSDFIIYFDSVDEFEEYAEEIL